jgi:hypothetical protein
VEQQIRSARPTNSIGIKHHLAVWVVRNLSEIGAREKIDNSYVSRMVNLTSLAPDIVAAILDDSLPNHVTLFDLAVDPPLLWDEQRARVLTA